METMSALPKRIYYHLIEHSEGIDVICAESQDLADEELQAYCEEWWEIEIGHDERPVGRWDLINHYFNNCDESLTTDDTILVTIHHKPNRL